MKYRKRLTVRAETGIPRISKFQVTVFTTNGYDPGVPEERLEELKAFGASLK